MKDHISNGAIKVIELVGISTKSFEDAIQQAVHRATATIACITGIEVEHLTGKVEGRAVTEFHANVKLAFIVKESIV